MKTYRKQLKDIREKSQHQQKDLTVISERGVFFDFRKPKFHEMGNCIMVDVKVPIDKITIDEETGKDTLWCGKFSTSTTDIANKGVQHTALLGIEEFILNLLKKKIPITGVSLVEDMNVIGYDVPGFSKSGNVTLFESKGQIYASSRYNQTNEINNFDDLVMLAWDWYIRYKDRSPFENPDSIWTPYFIEKGWIKKVMKYEYEIVK